MNVKIILCFNFCLIYFSWSCCLRRTESNRYGELIALEIYDPPYSTELDVQNVYSITIQEGILYGYFDPTNNNDPYWGLVDNTKLICEIFTASVNDDTLSVTIKYRDKIYTDIKSKEQI